jgi:uncharacterized protein YjbI with pentapeptide repeats
MTVMTFRRPTSDDWPAGLYCVALLVPPGLFALGWAQGYCGSTRCHESRPVLVALAGVAAVAVPAVVALALHRRRPLDGRVGARLPSGERGRPLAVASLALVPPTAASVVVVLGSDLSDPTTLPAAVFLLPLVAANALLRDAAPGPLAAGLGFAAIALAGVWVVAIAWLADAAWRRLVAVLGGGPRAVGAALLVLLLAVGGAGAMHVDVPYGRHVTQAEPAGAPAPPSALGNGTGREVAARHAAVETRNRLLERYGLHGDHRVGSVAVDCPTTRVLARDPSAVYVEVFCFPTATVVSTPWATERYSGPLWSGTATYAVRHDGVERVDAPVVAGHLLAPGRDLAGVALAGADLGQVELHGATLDGADLTDADLSATNLSGASLRNASLRNASVDIADLRGADLTGADLRNASFDARLDASTRLVNVDLRRATVGAYPSFVGVDARGARFDGAVLGSGIAGAAANISAARLANASFADAQMRQVTLDGADLHAADLSGAMLYRASLRDADLHDADLSDADLGLADLRGADLRGVDLRGARLWEADLRGADLRGATLEGSRWREAQLDGAVLPADVSR